MKRNAIALYALTSALLFSACTFPVHAAEQNACAISPEVQQKAEDMLDSMVQVQISSAATMDSYSDFSGYDASKGYALYHFSFHSKDDYKTSGSFSAMLGENPTYVIPYENENAEGLIYLSSDAQGALKFQKRVLDQKSVIDPEKIAETAAQLEDVVEVRLIREFMSDLQFAYVITETGEYVIPCSSGRVLSFFEGLNNGAVYTVEEFMNWVEYGFDWENFDGMANGSGLPNYIGYAITPVEHVSADMPDYVIPAGASMLGLAGAGCLTAVGVKLLKKEKKNS